MHNPAEKPKLAEDLPPPPRLDAAAIAQIRSEAQADRLAMDQLVSNMQTLSPMDFKIRLG